RLPARPHVVATLPHCRQLASFRLAGCLLFSIVTIGQDEDPFGNVGYIYIQHPIDLLTSAERIEIEAYTVGGFQRINSALRGHTPMTADLQKSVDIIRSALHRFPLKFEARATREVSAKDVSIASSGDAPTLVGQVIEQLGFLSTSMCENPPRSTAHVDPIELDLLLPAGTAALAVGSLSEYPLERELLVIDARRIFIVQSRWNARAERWRLYGQVLPEGVLT
ncbi:ADP-ribosyltransferase, partial [Mycobacterium marinum]|uniref:ADP-ribosyltransferase n=1 Tax=Mycobacterium marinum TaxID=1781 RepID=UPI0021C451C1